MHIYIYIYLCVYIYTYIYIYMTVSKKTLDQLPYDRGHVKLWNMLFYLHTGRIPEEYRKNTGRVTDPR